MLCEECGKPVKDSSTLVICDECENYFEDLEIAEIVRERSKEPATPLEIEEFARELGLNIEDIEYLNHL